MLLQIHHADQNVQSSVTAIAIDGVLLAEDRIHFLNSEIASAAEEQSVVPDEVSRVSRTMRAIVLHFLRRHPELVKNFRV